MIGLMFATKMEAGPFMSAKSTIRLDGWSVPIYQIDTMPWVYIAISGIGKVAAAIACQILIRELKVHEIINAGACGALVSGAQYEPGKLFCVASAVEGDHELLGKKPQPLISDGRSDWNLPVARLVTSDIPVFDAKRRQSFAEIGELVDMEGAAIARVAAKFSTPWSMVKGISDAAGPLDRDTLISNLKMVSEAVGTCLWAHLDSETEG